MAMEAADGTGKELGRAVVELVFHLFDASSSRASKAPILEVGHLLASR